MPARKVIKFPSYDPYKNKRQLMAHTAHERYILYGG